MESSSPPNILAIFEELDARVDKEGYTFASEEDVDRWAGQLDVDWLSCLDLIGAELAKKYHANEVSYEFGDSLANDLNSTLMFRHEQVPEGSWPFPFFGRFMRHSMQVSGRPKLTSSIRLSNIPSPKSQES